MKVQTLCRSVPHIMYSRCPANGPRIKQSLTVRHELHVKPFKVWIETVFKCLKPCQMLFRSFNTAQNASDEWTNFYGDFLLRGQVFCHSSESKMLTPT